MGTRCDEIMSKNSYLPYRMGYLTEWMVEKARIELNETEENRVKALAEFRQLIAADEKLTCWTDDAYLLQYLRARKFDAKKAFTLFRNFYTVKKDYKEVYPVPYNINPLKKFYTEGAGAFFPYRDENGAVIIIIRVARWDPDVFPVQIALGLLTAIILSAVEDSATQVCGVHIMLDAKGISLRHIRALTPRYIQLFSKALRNTLPVRFKGIHFYNESIIFSYFWSLLKLFLSEKIKSRVHCHGDSLKHLHKCIPKAILPADYGGEVQDYTEAEWCERELPEFLERMKDLSLKGYVSDQ